MSVTLLGFFFGLKHALEADHLAAVATLVTRASTRGEIVKQALAWAVGHALALFALAGSLLLLGQHVGAVLATLLEGLVGAVLIYLGARLLLAHTPQGLALPGFHPALPLALPLTKPTTAALRPAFLVGLLHGTAGSAVLVAVTASTVASPTAALLYVLLFAAGSVSGMALVAALCAHPLAEARRRESSWRMVCLLLGGFTIALGALLVGEAAQQVFFSAR